MDVDCFRANLRTIKFSDLLVLSAVFVLCITINFRVKDSKLKYNFFIHGWNILKLVHTIFVHRHLYIMLKVPNIFWGGG